MVLPKQAWAVRLLVWISFASVASAENYWPQRVTGDLTAAPYSSAGYVESYFGKKSFSGSASVALDHRLAFGAAHVVYDNGRWAGLFAFARAYNGSLRPGVQDFVYARGFRILEGYAANKRDDYFDYDFAVAYAGYGGDFGPALDLADDARNSLTGTQAKRILGYPAYLDYYWDNFGSYVSGDSFLHETGDFQLAFQEDSGFWSYDLPYMVVDDVSTGPGNSGGPVLVHDDGDWKLAGILVSGGFDYWTSTSSAGVFSLDGNAKSAAAEILSSVENGFAKQVVISPKKPLILKDGSTTYKSMTFDFGRLPYETVRVALSLDIQAVGNGEIYAFLRSPSGRTYSVPSGSINADGEIVGDFSSDGSDSGRWTLYARDKVPGTASVLVNRAALTITSRWP